MERRRNNITALRLALAALVVCSHAVPLVTGNNERDWLYRLTGRQLSAGELAVSGFFALSGWLLALSWQRTPRLGRFLSRRLRRLVPGFAACYLVCLTAVPLLAGVTTAPLVTVDWWWQALCALRFSLPSVVAFPGHAFPTVLNGSVWSLQYEWWCYVLLAALGVSGALRCPRVVLALWLAALGWLAWWGSDGAMMPGHAPVLVSFVLGWPGFYPRLVAAFLAGTVAALYRDRLRLTWRGALGALTVLVAVAVARHGLMLVLPVAGTYLLLALAYLPRPRLAWLDAWDGSYGVYLYGWPVAQLLLVRWPHLAPPLLGALALPLALALGLASWRLVERPALRGRAARVSAPVRPARDRGAQWRHRPAPASRAVAPSSASPSRSAPRYPPSAS